MGVWSKRGGATVGTTVLLGAVLMACDPGVLSAFAHKIGHHGHGGAPGHGGTSGEGGSAGQGEGVRASVAQPMIVEVLDDAGQVQTIEVPISFVEIDVADVPDDSAGYGGAGGTGAPPSSRPVRRGTPVVDVALPPAPARGRQAPFFGADVPCPTGGTATVSMPDVVVDVPPLDPGDTHPRRIRLPAIEITAPLGGGSVRVRTPPMEQVIPGSGTRVRVPAVEQGVPQTDEQEESAPDVIRVSVPEEQVTAARRTRVTVDQQLPQ